MNTTKLIQLLSKSKNTRNDIESLLIEILDIREKFKNQDNTSFYFRKGIEHQKVRIEELEKEFEYLRQDINSVSLEGLQIRLIKQDLELKRWKTKSEIHICDMIAISAIQSGLNRIKSLIRLKRLYSHLEPLEFYLENKDELLKLF